MRTLGIILFFLFFSGLHAEPSTSLNAFQAGFTDNATIDGEYIDVRTGKVYWETEDIRLPGNGLDLVVSRSLRKAPFAERGMLGSWNLEIPRISLLMTQRHYGALKYGKRLCDKSIFSGFKGMVLLIPGEKPKDVLLASKGGPYPSHAKYVTTDHWLIGCERKEGRDVYRVYSPAGVEYQLDVLGQDEEHGVTDKKNDDSQVRMTAYASRVTDRYGNRIDYDYDFTLIQGYDTDKEQSVYYNQKPHLINVRASDGRQVSFSYTNEKPSVNAPSNLPKVKTFSVNGKTWRYEYIKEHVLNKVTLPDGSYWELKHSFIKADFTIHTPKGAVISYEFKPHNWSQFSRIRQSKTQAPIHSLVKKRITGPTLTPLVQTYSYNLTSNKNYNQTTVETHNHHWVQYHFHRPPTDDPWSMGLLAKKVIYPPKSHEPIRSEEFTWIKGHKAGDSVIEGKEALAVNPYTPTLHKRVIDKHFVTTFSDFDDFSMPRLKRESHVDTKTTRYTYRHLQSPWVIGLPTRVIEEDIGTTSYRYDSVGRVTQLTKYGTESFYEYTSQGLLKSKSWYKDGELLTESYSNHYRGQPQRIVKADATAIRHVVNNDGLITRTINARDQKTYYEYDLLNRLTKTSPPLSEPVHEVWVSQTQHVTSKGRLRIIKSYDEIGRLVKLEEKDTLNNTSRYRRFAYDALGREVFASIKSYNPLEPTGTKTVYDPLGRVVEKIKVPEQYRTRICYDAQCRKAPFSVDFELGEVRIDPLGFKTITRHRVFGEPTDRVAINIKQQLAKSPETFQTTAITYNLANQIASVTQDGFTRYYEYDDQLRLHRERHPEYADTVFAYDEPGNIKTKTVGDTTITYGYDKLNRQVSIDAEGDESITKAYDNNGNLVEVSNSLTTWRYRYDAEDRLVEEALQAFGKQFMIGYDYTTTGYLKSVTTPSGRQLSYIPDVYGQPQQVSGIVASATYHANGGVKSLLYDNGLTQTVIQDSRGFPKRLSSQQGQTLFDLSYRFNSRHQITDIINHVNPDETLSLNYDGNKRLKMATGPWGEASFEYDERDNILQRRIGNDTHSYVYDGQNRLEQVDGRQFGYDERGNITDNGKHTFVFDAFNRISTANTVEPIHYLYDGHHHRIRRQQGADSVITIKDQKGNKLYTLDEASGEQTDFVYLQDKLLAKIKTTATEEAVTYYHNNLLGSPELATDEAGNILWRESYLPFGEKRLEEDITEDNGYTGKTFEKDTGLTNLGARFYDPTTGRFMSIDPVGFTPSNLQSFNRYCYVNNNPYNYVDPDGRFLQAVVAIGFAIAGGYRSYKEEGTLGATLTGAGLGLITGIGFGRLGTAIHGFAKAGNVVSKSKAAQELAGLSLDAGVGASGAAVGAISSGGTPTDIAIAATIGAAGGLISSDLRIGKALKSTAIGVGTNFASQVTTNILDDEKNYKDINLSELAGAAVGGYLAGAAYASSGDSIVDAFSGFLRGSVTESAFGLMGKDIGEQQGNENE